MVRSRHYFFQGFFMSEKKTHYLLVNFGGPRSAQEIYPFQAP